MENFVISTEALARLVGSYEDAPSLQEVLGRLGKQTRPQRDETQLSFISFRNYGISFAYEDEATFLRKEQPLGGKSLLTAIHLYSEGFEGYHQYQQPLPSGLIFRDGREEVHRKLGTPSATGGGKRALGRLWPSWDRYDFDNYSLAVQYSPDFSNVDLVSLIARAKVRVRAMV
jgi:hypothetical protein